MKHSLVIFGLATMVFCAKTFAQENCDDIYFEINGIQNTVINQTHKYILALPPKAGTGNKYTLDNSKVSYTIFYENKFQQTIWDSSFFFAFPEAGNYMIQAKINFHKCEYIVEKDIRVFETSYIYMWTFLDEFNFWILDNIQQYWVFLQTIISDEYDHTKHDEFLSNLEPQTPYFHNSKDIFINIKNYGLIFEMLDTLQDSYWINLNKKNIFIITETNKSVVKKFLVKFVKQSWIDSIFVLNRTELDNIIFNLSIWKEPYDDTLLQDSSMNFAEGKISYRFSYIIDYLIFHGFPLDIIELFLSLAFAVLIISFSKQVIGLHSFGVYYPILFWLSIHIAWTKTVLWLLFIAFFAKMLVKWVLKNKNILITAQLGLYVITYIFLTIIGLTIYKFLGISQNDFMIFTNPMIMIVFIVMLMVWAKLWNKTFPFKSIAWRKDFLWFLVLSLLIYFVLSSQYLHHIFLMYPWIIFLCLILVFAIWRYLWLQITEIFRFWPLIQHLRKKHRE